jgi:hypothetical protein
MNTFITSKSKRWDVMKTRHLTAILFLVVLLTPMISPVLTQSNHTLEWGVDQGEEFIYVLQRAYYADSNNRAYIEAPLPFLAEMQPGQKVTLEIASLETIESMINESAQLPRSYCNLLRSNDSELILADLPSFVVPLIDTTDEWGIVRSGIIPGTGGANINVRIEMRYEKENGTLNYLRHKYTSLGNDLIDVIFVHWYPGMPTIVGGGVQTTTLMIIAVSGVMFLLVAFIVYRVVKGKKSVVQRLGE